MKADRRVIVIGAGASGLAAAIAAADAGAFVTVLEHMEAAGKKLLMTGNGRCNFTNTDVSPQHYHGDSTLITAVLSQLTAADCIRFFQSLGVYPKVRHYAYDDSGYVYPASGEASCVRDALLREALRLQVRVVYGCTLHEVCVPPDAAVSTDSDSKHSRRSRAAYVLRTSQGSFEADAVIFATGSNAAPKTGSDSSLYPILQALGIPFQTFRPALCPITCKEHWLSDLKGLRMEAKTVLFAQAEQCAAQGAPNGLASAFGEVQFNENAVSGIPIFQLSRHVPLFLAAQKQRKRAASKEMEASLPAASANLGAGQTETDRLQLTLQLALDFAPQMEETALARLIEKLLQKGQGLCGLLPSKLAALLQAQEATAAAMAHRLKHFALTPTGTGGFSQAQCCSGGIPASALEGASLQLKGWKGLYAAGELLDVDGDCGGYNLHWAFASGLAAGKAAALGALSTEK